MFVSHYSGKQLKIFANQIPHLGYLNNEWNTFHSSNLFYYPRIYRVGKLVRAKLSIQIIKTKSNQTKCEWISKYAELKSKRISKSNQFLYYEVPNKEIYL